MNSTQIALTLTFFLTCTAHAFLGIGTNALPLDQVPDAVCRIEIAPGSNCSGTVILPKGSSEPPVLSTANHCLKDLPDGQTLNIQCGCSLDGCKEGFIISNPQLSPDPQNFDHARASLDHTPEKITPLAVANPSDYFKLKESDQVTLSTNMIQEGVQCFKGGFGVTETEFPALYPRFFPTSSLYLTTLKGWLLQEPVGFIDLNIQPEYAELIQTIMAEKSSPYEKQTAHHKLARALLKKKLITNTLMGGDSGSGLLCRKNGGDFVWLGVAVMIKAQPLQSDNDIEPSQYFLLNQFQLLPNDTQ